MTKYGEVTTESHSDFNPAKKAEYYDADGFEIADKANKNKLKKPVKIVDEDNGNKVRD